MDIRDFQGLRKYKFIIPTLYVLGWIGLLVGPILMENFYRKFCVISIGYGVIKMGSILLTMLIVIYKLHKHLSKLEEIKTQSNQIINQFNHGQNLNYAFVIPNYDQQLDILINTLNVLASHSRAKTKYMVFLAMQQHQEDSQEKAKILVKNFKEKFRLMHYTLHSIQPFEQKGKASNVSWCVEHLQPFFAQNSIDPTSVFLTIMDADSQAPNQFYDLLENHIENNFDTRHISIFQPTQLFNRNNLDVPVFVRVQDILTSIAHLTNMASMFDLTYSLSNYVISYSLAKRIGFWDTCADAIGEDFHTVQKAYWKTQGNVIGVPIYIPFSQVNIQTGQGYISDIKARFWQAQRHAQGCADVAYNFKQLIQAPFRIKNVILFLQIFELFSLPAVLPWVMISNIYQDHIFYANVPQYPYAQLTSNMFMLLQLFNLLTYLGYEYYKRKCTPIFSKRSNQHILHIFDYLILVGLNFFFIVVPTFTIAIYTVLSSNRQYTVAPKKNTSALKN